MSSFLAILRYRVKETWFGFASVFCLIGLICACSSLPASSVTSPALSKLQDGDIIFQTSRSSQSRAIQIATHSKYSHMGIVFRKDGRLWVLEAVGPVKLTPIESWIRRGVRSEYVVKRLRKQHFSASAVKSLWLAGSSFIGKPYDPYFGWSNDKIYCSELVWKVYRTALGVEVGKLRELRSFDLSAREVQMKLKQRYGTAIPLSESVISPADIFDSDLLQPV